MVSTVLGCLSLHMKVIRCARLALPVDLPSLQAEVAALPDRWKPHFQTAHYEGDWTVLQLRSIKGNRDETMPFALIAQLEEELSGAE